MVTGRFLRALANNTAMGVNNMRARVIFFASLEQDALNKLWNNRNVYQNCTPILNQT
jgi:hypothetical protein